jgi:hypothetical protein
LDDEDDALDGGDVLLLEGEGNRWLIRIVEWRWPRDGEAIQCC